MATIHYKKCPQCGQPAVLSMSQCQRCGHVYRTAPAMPGYVPPKTQFFEDGPFAEPVAAGPQVGLIVLMYAFWAASIYAFTVYGFGAAAMVDLVSIAFAIVLVTSHNTADRINGGIKLGMEGAMFLFAFFSTFPAR